MTVRTILTYPNPGLRLCAAPVALFDAALRELAEDLLDTMCAAQGIGITAPHIGTLQRLVVIRLSPADTVKYYVNPQIVSASQVLQKHKEGSISMQDVLEEIERPAHVEFCYQDLFGNERVGEAEGLLCTCLQHEIDQLDGIFWLDRLSRLKRERVVKRFQKLQRAQ